jgi:MFS family permease
MYLLGVITGLLIFIRASDIYGRKTFLLFTSHINTMCYLALICFCSSMNFTYFLLFLMGLSASVRNNIGYVYGIELMPKPY